MSYDEPADTNGTYPSLGVWGMIAGLFAAAAADGEFDDHEENTPDEEGNGGEESDGDDIETGWWRE